MNDTIDDRTVLRFPVPERVEMGPGSAFEAVTRTKVDELAEDVKEIRARIDGIFWLIAGSIVVDVLMRAIGLG